MTSPIHYLKSLGSGALVSSSERERRQKMSNKQRVVVNTSRASYNPSLQLTTIADDNDDYDDDFTAGSTATGDSFVPHLDHWSCNNNSNESSSSLEDPYLQPKERILWRRHEQQQQHEQVHHYRPRCWSYSKSLGSFHFPEDPALLCGGTSSTVDGDEQLENDNDKDNNNNNDSSPPPQHVSMPLPKHFGETDEVSVRSTLSHESRPEQRRAALAKAAALEQQQQQQSSSTLHLLHLGTAYLDAAEPERAAQVFQQAATQAQHYNNNPVARAHALHRAGVAYTAAQRPDQAVPLLQQALALRIQHLGPWHVDAVDSMNHLGNAYSASTTSTSTTASGAVAEAVSCYWQVFWLRKAIFGNQHASVAVAAHELGNALYRTGQLEDADNFYQIALTVYEQNLGVSRETHPAVARLWRNIKRLERVERWAAESGK